VTLKEKTKEEVKLAKQKEVDDLKSQVEKILKKKTQQTRKETFLQKKNKPKQNIGIFQKTLKTKKKSKSKGSSNNSKRCWNKRLTRPRKPRFKIK
jgi:uncharacterized glyoxalase superfamily metalloenzyme YdcJ